MRLSLGVNNDIVSSDCLVNRNDHNNLIKVDHSVSVAIVTSFVNHIDDAGFVDFSAPSDLLKVLITKLHSSISYDDSAVLINAAKEV